MPLSAVLETCATTQRLRFVVMGTGAGNLAAQLCFAGSLLLESKQNGIRDASARDHHSAVSRTTEQQSSFGPNLDPISVLPSSNTVNSMRNQTSHGSSMSTPNSMRMMSSRDGSAREPGAEHSNSNLNVPSGDKAERWDSEISANRVPTSKAGEEFKFSEDELQEIGSIEHSHSLNLELFLRGGPGRTIRCRFTVVEGLIGEIPVLKTEPELRECIFIFVSQDSTVDGKTIELWQSHLGEILRRASHVARPEETKPFLTVMRHEPASSEELTSVRDSTEKSACLSEFQEQMKLVGSKGFPVELMPDFSDVRTCLRAISVLSRYATDANDQHRRTRALHSIFSSGDTGPSGNVRRSRCCCCRRRPTEPEDTVRDIPTSEVKHVGISVW